MSDAADLEIVNQMARLLREDARREGLSILSGYVAASSARVNAAIGRLAAYELLDGIVRNSGGDLLERWAQEVGARKAAEATRDALATALEDCLHEMVSEAKNIGFDDYHEAINAARHVLRHAGRLP